MDSHCRQIRHTKSYPFNQLHLKHHSHRQNVKNDAHFRGFCVPLLGTCQKISLSLKFFVCGETLFAQQRWYEDSITFAFAWPVGVNEALVINNRHFNIHSHLIQWDLFFSYLRCCLLSVRTMRQEGRRKTIPPHKPHSFHLSFILSIHALLFVFYLSCRFLSRGITKALQKIGHFGFGWSY